MGVTPCDTKKKNKTHIISHTINEQPVVDFLYMLCVLAKNPTGYNREGLCMTQRTNGGTSSEYSLYTSSSWPWQIQEVPLKAPVVALIVFPSLYGAISRGRSFLTERAAVFHRWVLYKCHPFCPHLTLHCVDGKCVLRVTGHPFLWSAVKSPLSYWW